MIDPYSPEVEAARLLLRDNRLQLLREAITEMRQEPNEGSRLWLQGWIYGRIEELAEFDAVSEEEAAQLKAEVGPPGLPTRGGE